jgi:hypothetical protein
MVIDINRKEISIGNKYTIFVNGKQQWSASKEILNILSNLHVSIYPDGTEVIEIRQKNLLISPEFSIRIAGKAVLQLTTVSNWKNIYQCIDDKDIYTIYGHAGTKYSVFKNGIQIAYWDESSVNVLNGEQLKIYADLDANKELLVAFCLAADNFSSNSNTNTITINFGNIGWWLRKFDKTWKPKE